MPSIVTKWLHQWVHDAQPGESTVYYTGFLGADVRPDINVSDLQRFVLRLAGYERVKPDRSGSGIPVWTMVNKPAVYLTQRRLGFRRYEYIMTRASDA